MKIRIGDKAQFTLNFHDQTQTVASGQEEINVRRVPCVGICVGLGADMNYVLFAVESIADPDAPPEMRALLAQVSPVLHVRKDALHEIPKPG